MRSVMAALVISLFLMSPAGSTTASTVDHAQIAAVETSLRPANPIAGEPVTRTLSHRMSDLKVPGVSIAFLENGKVKWVRSYGVADVAKGQPVTPNTLFQAASMSKAVAAAGALRLVEQGRLSLDEDVNGRLRAWKVPASAFTSDEKVTLRRLLGHTAGLTVSGFPGYQASKPVPTVVQILEGTAPAITPAVRSFEAPGQAYAYSGGGFTVAQLLMVEAGGKSFPDLLDTLVLRPAMPRHGPPAPETTAGLGCLRPLRCRIVMTSCDVVL